MYRFTILPCRGVETSKFLEQINDPLLTRRGLKTLSRPLKRLSCATLVGVSKTQMSVALHSGFFSQRFCTDATTFSDNRCALHTPRRAFMTNLFRPSSSKVKVDDLVYDTESPRYRGTIFGLPADAVVFYSKIFAGVAAALFAIYFFSKGIIWVTRFNPQTIARMGFVSGFVCCMVIYNTILRIAYRVQINTSAVYNHSIALVMRNAKAREFLGETPRIGDFKVHAATGGFKLPRIWSEPYELSDFLGLKPRRLQMVFVLKAPTEGREGVVYCDVRKELTGFMTSESVYKSLIVTLIDAPKKVREKVIVIGRPEDMAGVSLLF